MTPSLADVGELRQTSYGQSRLTWIDHLGVWLSRRAVLRQLPQKSNLTVLDLGCGYRAALLQSLLPYLRQGVGVDVAVAREVRAESRLSFHEGAIESVLPRLDADRFDLVLFISVLEHLPDPLAALNECRRVLRPGGVLLVNVPTWRGKFFLEFSAFRLGTSPAEEMDDHKMYYDRRDLWPLLVRAGFRPSGIRLKYHKFGLNLFGVARKP
jgi:SAM-dependent methyltransferase